LLHRGDGIPFISRVAGPPPLRLSGQR
jgi:hypothetical protein